MTHFLLQGFEMKDENYLSTAAFMWGSLWIFYMFEVLTKIVFHKGEVRHYKVTFNNILLINSLTRMCHQYIEL
jgi:hypothetical protein